jgi:hypothetical protein
MLRERRIHSASNAMMWRTSQFTYVESNWDKKYLRAQVDLSFELLATSAPCQMPKRALNQAGCTFVTTVVLGPHSLVPYLSAS